MLSSDHVKRNLSIIGERILQCKIHIRQGSKSTVNELLLKYVCALLNSGGGVIQLENHDKGSSTQSKDRDVWWSGMENKLKYILSRDDICNYFDLVGNFDDDVLFLFVKTAENLCTLDYHSRLPTDTATNELTYHSAIKLLANSELPPGNISDLPKIPHVFKYGQTEETLKQETKQIQFKMLTLNRDNKTPLPDRIPRMVIKYVSSFGNHEGGHIYFGIEDKKAAAYGELIIDRDEDDIVVGRKMEEEIVRKIKNKMESVIWKDPPDLAQKLVQGKHWDVQFVPVINCPQNLKSLSTRKVIVVSICKLPGGVFTKRPESFYLSESGKVEQFPYAEWKEKMLLPLQEIKSLHDRFVKVPMHVPSSPLVYTLPNTAKVIKEKLFQMSTGHQLYPKYFLDSVTNSRYLFHMTKILKLCEGYETVQIVIQSLGFNITDKPDHVLCDILLISGESGFHLFTFTEMAAPSIDIQKHSQYVASLLKKKLVLDGGCTEKFGILSHVIDLQDEVSISSFKRDELLNFPYPSTYRISVEKVSHVLRSLIILLGKYKSHDLQQKRDFYFLFLTCAEFELLWMNQNVKKLWNHEPPGSGKTVAAVQLIKKFCIKGNQNGTLYNENELLHNCVRNMDDKDLMNEDFVDLSNQRASDDENMDDKDLMNEDFVDLFNQRASSDENMDDKDQDFLDLPSSGNQRASSDENMDNKDLINPDLLDFWSSASSDGSKTIILHEENRQRVIKQQCTPDKGRERDTLEQGRTDGSVTGTATCTDKETDITSSSALDMMTSPVSVNVTKPQTNVQSLIPSPVYEIMAASMTQDSTEPLSNIGNDQQHKILDSTEPLSNIGNDKSHKAITPSPTLDAVPSDASGFQGEIPEQRRSPTQEQTKMLSREINLEEFHHGMAPQFSAPSTLMIERYHPSVKFDNITINCCAHCKGEVKAV